ncbi:MAG TPA: hypothetical protein VMO00_13870 [Methylomirabilota bacterium]|nr:hypothetical protein [Methylomirabilota bacterium]
MRDLKAFDIRKREDRYVVQCGYQCPPAPTPLTLEYGLDEIKEIDLRGQGTRSDIPQTLDFSTLSQSLRTIGGYLDNKKASMVRICNNDLPGTEPIFRIEYETAEGDLLVDDRSAAAIYDIGVHMYKQRGKMNGGTANSARPRR